MLEKVDESCISQNSLGSGFFKLRTWPTIGKSRGALASVIGGSRDSHLAL